MLCITDIEIIVIPNTSCPATVLLISFRLSIKLLLRLFSSLLSSLLSRVRETCFEDKLMFIELNL